MIMGRTRRKNNKRKTKRKRCGVLTAKELATKEALTALMKSEKAASISYENRLLVTLGQPPIVPKESG